MNESRSVRTKRDWDRQFSSNQEPFWTRIRTGVEYLKKLGAFSKFSNGRSKWTKTSKIFEITDPTGQMKNLEILDHANL